MIGRRITALVAVGFCAACTDVTDPVRPAVTGLSEARRPASGIRITDLGTLGGDRSIAAGLNTPAAGRPLLIVGNAQNAAGQTRASYWYYDPASGAQPAVALAKVDDDTQSLAFAANQSEQIVGYSSKLTLVDGVYSSTSRAVRWPVAGDGLILPGFGGTRASASSISFAGQVLGYATTEEGKVRPFLWDPNSAPAGTLKDLGFFSGHDIQPADFNEDGIVVGSLRFDPPPEPLEAYTSAELQTAFVWSASAGLRRLPDLGPPPTRDGVQSVASGINNKGVIVGFVNTAGYGLRAVRWNWTEDGTADGSYKVQDLGLGAGSRARDINNSDEIVGGFRAKRYSTGFFLSGSTFKELPILSYFAIAHKINDSGEIVGMSYFRNSYEHAVLWTNVRDP